MRLIRSGIRSVKRVGVKKYLKNFAEKFADLKYCRTFAIPNQTSGGGEMVDTLL